MDLAASNAVKKKWKKAIVDLSYDFKKAYDNVNHGFPEKLLDDCCFQQAVHPLIVETMAR